MAFKMKGFPLHSGTSIAKQYKSDAQRKAIYASKAERSAAKQKSADLKTLDELIEEGFTPADARRMQKDKAVTGVEKETDKQKMQRLEDEAAKANKAGDTEKAKKLMAQVSKLEDKIQGTTKPPTKQKKDLPKPPPAPVPTFTPPGYGKLSPYNKETKKDRKKKKKDEGKEISPTKQRSIEKLDYDFHIPKPPRPTPPPNRITSIRRANFEPVEFIERPMPMPLPNPMHENRFGYLQPVEPRMQKMEMPKIEKLSANRDFNTMSIPKEKKKGKKGPGRRSKVGKKLTKVANIFRKKGNKRSPDFK